MPETKHFDPLGWLLSVSFALLAAAGALALAVYIILSIWPWLLASAVVALVVAVLVRLVFWWRGGQPW